MKCLAVVAACCLFGCLSPVSEGRDAGPCRESLGLAKVNEDLLQTPTAGELREGRYFFGNVIPIDSSTFKRIDEPDWGIGPPGPCGNPWGSWWWHLPNASYVHFEFSKNARAYVLLYEYSDALQAQIEDACRADGGFGPTKVLLDLPPDRAYGMRAAAFAKTDSGFLACNAHLDDAGVARDMVLYRTDDGGVVSSVPSSAEHCVDLRPPMALTWSVDGGRELINFDTRQANRIPAGNCRLTRDGAAFCGSPSAATLVWGQGSTELVREEGAKFWPMTLTLRDRQFVQRISADGGYGWYWFRNGELELLDEGMPISTIGDFDDHNIFYVVSRNTPDDGGYGVEFERRCLPN